MKQFILIIWMVCSKRLGSIKTCQRWTSCRNRVYLGSSSCLCFVSASLNEAGAILLLLLCFFISSLSDGARLQAVWHFSCVYFGPCDLNTKAPHSSPLLTSLMSHLPVIQHCSARTTLCFWCPTGWSQIHWSCCLSLRLIIVKQL